MVAAGAESGFVGGPEVPDPLLGGGAFCPPGCHGSALLCLLPRCRDWPEALHWYSSALEKSDCDEGGGYDGMADEPRYALLAREAEMLLAGGFRLPRDPQRSGRREACPEVGGRAGRCRPRLCLLALRSARPILHGAGLGLRGAGVQTSIYIYWSYVRGLGFRVCLVLALGGGFTIKNQVN